MKALRALALLASWPGWAAAQSASVGSVAQVYTFSEPAGMRVESVGLLAFPFTGGVPLGRSFALGVSGAYAHATVSLPTGERTTNSGLTDTRATVQAMLGSLRASASALLPTGRVVATEEEAILAGMLSTELLPFAVSQWGVGGGYDAELAYASRAGSVLWSLSAGGSMLSESKPMSDELTFRPGKEVRGRGALEAPVGTAGVLAMALGVQRFTVDTYAGFNLFRSGTRIDGGLSYSFPIGAQESISFLGGVTRTAAGVLETPPAFHVDFPGFSAAASARPARTIFRAASEIMLRRGRRALIPRAEMRLLRRADGIGQGWLASLGGRGELGFMPRGLRHAVVLEPAVALRIGRVVADGDLASGIFGWQAGLTLRWER